MKYQIVVIGGGPAGLAAACSARTEGASHVLIIERCSQPGGILPQCIHDGFGVEKNGSYLTGPEYADLWINRAREAGVDFITDCNVTDIRHDEDGYELGIISPQTGKVSLVCQAVILASGCMERNRGALRIPGDRPAGIFTAGQVQYMMNIQNLLPGKSAVVLGTGDIGLIMARRMKWEGIDVKLMLGDRASGLIRNYVQCACDWEIPLLFGHTVTAIHGRKRLEGVTIAPVDESGTPDLEKAQHISCDTLVIAAGLVPESEIWDMLQASKEKQQGLSSDTDELSNTEKKTQALSVYPDEISTPEDGFFVCGNVVRQYDTVEEVTASGQRAGLRAVQWISGKPYDENAESINKPAFVEKHILTDEDLLYFSGSKKLEENTSKLIYCIRCPRSCRITIDESGSISGNSCETGLRYAEAELTSPVRIVTSTMGIEGVEDRVLPVRTSAPVDKGRVYEVLKICRDHKVSLPVSAGQAVIKGIFKEIDIIACKDMV